jgi:hypothetical protein
LLDVPFVYLSNGEELWGWEPAVEAHPRRIATLPSQLDLERLLALREQRRNPLSVPIDQRIVEIIRGAITRDPNKRLVKSTFDEASFGNFIISFEEDGRARSVVNDRGELVVCSDLEGSRDCVTVLGSLHGADEQLIINALKL